MYIHIVQGIAMSGNTKNARYACVLCNKDESPLHACMRVENTGVVAVFFKDQKIIHSAAVLLSFIFTELSHKTRDNLKSSEA